MGWSLAVATDLGEMRCHPLTSDLFGELEQVFGERGAARRCFCMHWRRPDGGFTDPRDNRDRFADVVATGRPPGLIGRVDEEPVGWVQVGPRCDFPTIKRSRLLKPIDETDVWSINCFVVRAGHRRRGIGSGLLTAAIGYARHQGAMVVEAYPVDGMRSSSVDYFTGTLGMFARRGFTEVARRNETRPIVRLSVGPESAG